MKLFKINESLFIDIEDIRILKVIERDRKSDNDLIMYSKGHSEYNTIFTGNIEECIEISSQIYDTLAQNYYTYSYIPKSVISKGEALDCADPNYVGKLENGALCTHPDSKQIVLDASTIKCEICGAIRKNGIITN